MRLNCPVCSKTLDVPEKSLGKLIRCPACTQTFVANPALANAPKRKNDAPVRRGPITEDDYVLPGGSEDVAQDATATVPKLWSQLRKVLGGLKGAGALQILPLRSVATPSRHSRAPSLDSENRFPENLCPARGGRSRCGDLLSVPELECHLRQSRFNLAPLIECSNLTKHCTKRNLAASAIPLIESKFGPYWAIVHSHFLASI